VVRNDRSNVGLNNLAQTRALFAGTSNIEQSLTIGAEYRPGDVAHNAIRGLIDNFAVFGNFLSEEAITRLASGESVLTVGGPIIDLAVTEICLNGSNVVLT